ncbi:MAG TPA: class F sortase, partial [Gaiella sp.]|nr:class F sortase [Gaiella sp.]
LHDRVRVTGLGSASAAVGLELFGPFASRAAIRCTGSPVWSGRFTVEGDGIHNSPAVKLERAGFYAYRERIVASPLVAGGQSACGALPETALVRPLIITGGVAASAGHAVADAGDRSPVGVRIPRLGIDARLVPSAVDVANGVLGVPNDIRRPGWWRDGAAPGDRSGAVLVAGHVDSASRGAGAFYGLETARRGTLVELRMRNGRTKEYRVVSVRLMAKEKLPTDIYSRRGRPRLVLVTCGGPFDEARRHYRDNVVVTAVPV